MLLHPLDEGLMLSSDHLLHYIKRDWESGVWRAVPIFRGRIRSVHAERVRAIAESMDADALWDWAHDRNAPFQSLYRPWCRYEGAGARLAALLCYLDADTEATVRVSALLNRIYPPRAYDKSHETDDTHTGSKPSDK